MSDRLDAALSVLDVGLQDSDEAHVYSDVAPTMADTCVRCQRADRFDDSDWCERCRAYLLGDTTVDPACEWSGTMVVGGIPCGDGRYPPLRAPRGGIRYVEPPDLSPLTTRPDAPDVMDAFRAFGVALQPVWDVVVTTTNQLGDLGRAAGIIGPDGALTGPFRDHMLRCDITEHDAAYVDGDGRRVDPAMVRTLVTLDLPEGTSWSGMRYATGIVPTAQLGYVDAAGSPVERWTPPAQRHRIESVFGPPVRRDPIGYVDGGYHDIGVWRDTSLSHTNDLRIFAEEWVSVARLGEPLTDCVIYDDPPSMGPVDPDVIRRAHAVMTERSVVDALRVPAERVVELGHGSDPDVLV